MYRSEQFAWLGERRKNIYSQFGEDGILEAIFERIGTANKYCCECGAADGVFFSNTRHLIESAGWRGLQIEADKRLFNRLENLYPISGNVRVFNVRVETDGENSFDNLLTAAGAPIDLDLLVIDVDGQDYWLFNSLVKYKPRVVLVEYDPAADKAFMPSRGGQGQAGLDATIQLGIGHYYWPVAITSTNVIFVLQELCDKLAEPIEIAKHRHESVSGNTACVHCGLKGVWPLVKQPEIGKRVELHQAYEGRTDCFKCGLPVDDPRVCAPKVKPMLAAVMSTPRLGFLATMDCIFQGLMPLGVPLLRGEGAFWHQTLERAIEKAVAGGVKYILTFDYDVVFDSTQGNNEIAKLLCLMEDNPEVDCIVAAQMKREGGPLLATSAGEIRLLDALVPITQGHFGLTIFKAEAFAKIPKPWFRDFPNDEGSWNENRVDADIHFWRQAVDAGLNIQMSLDVLVGHLELVVTWPGMQLGTVYQSLNDWRENGKSAQAFNRQVIVEAVKANPALMYSPKLEMGD